MRISIQETEAVSSDEIRIQCRKVNDAVLEVVQKLNSSQNTITGLDGDKIHKLELADIFYFETVDNRSFFYCQDKVYETKLKLYEFEELTRGTNFFRSSKSVILNSDRIDFIKPVISGRFEACLENGETVVVSRQFVPDLKKILGV